MENNLNEQLENLVRQVDSEFKNELAKMDDKHFITTDRLLFKKGIEQRDGETRHGWGINENAIVEYPKEVQERFRQLFSELADQFNSGS